MKTYKEFKSEFKLDERYDKDLDKNKNGKLDKKDFELLRKKKSDCCEKFDLDAELIDALNENDTERDKHWETINTSKDKMQSLLSKNNPKLNHSNPNRIYQLDVRDTLNKMSPEDSAEYEKHRKLHNDALDAVRKIDNPPQNNRPIGDKDRFSGL